MKRKIASLATAGTVLFTVATPVAVAGATVGVVTAAVVADAGPADAAARNPLCEFHNVRFGKNNRRLAMFRFRQGRIHVVDIWTNPNRYGVYQTFTLRMRVSC